MEMEEELRKISLNYDVFDWDNLRLELVEILIIIVENYEKGNSGIFKELYYFPIEDNFASDEKRLISGKISELKNLGLVHTTNEHVNNRTVHIPNNLKKILLKKFPLEVKIYNEFRVEIIAKVKNKKNDNKVISSFKLPNNFKIKTV